MIGQRAVLWAVAAAIAASCSVGQTTAAADGSKAKRPPNVILLLADDLGAKELGCYGNTQHQTPNLDRLARTGVQLLTCYATPLCHPTRLELMTGQYGHHNKVYNFAGLPGGPRAGSPEEQIVNHFTFAQMLKDAGYVTALSGKWQLSGKLPSLVYETGFDEYCMWAYAQNLPRGVTHTGGYEFGNKTSRYWHPSIIKNGQYTLTAPSDFGPDLFNQFAIDFVRKNKDKPFFLYYTAPQTHNPFYPTPDQHPRDDEKFVDSRANFKANLEYLDKLVGRLVEALDESGLRENTILIFTGDNGTGGEGKGQATELGAPVPMIVNCPGRVKPTGKCPELVDFSDVMPTLAELCGAHLPQDRPIDGRSFAWILEGRPAAPREWIYSYLGPKRVVRTRRWLLEENSMTGFGRLYDCGASRDGTGYKDVTGSGDPEVLAAKKHLEEILADKPVPVVGKPAVKAKKAPAGKSGNRLKKKAAVEQSAVD